MRKMILILMITVSIPHLWSRVGTTRQGNNTIYPSVATDCINLQPCPLFNALHSSPWLSQHAQQCLSMSVLMLTSPIHHDVQIQAVGGSIHHFPSYHASTEFPVPISKKQVTPTTDHPQICHNGLVIS